MSEFITLHLGQCGNQIGSSFWPNVLEEYGIQNLNDENHKNYPKLYNNIDLQTSINSFFITPPSNDTFTSYNTLDDLRKAKVKARSVLIDMEESVISRIKSGPLRDLFDDRCILTSYPGSGNNWAEGFCYHGPRYEDNILNIIRRLIEKCDSLQGFLLLFSVGGGTGSGLGTFVLKLLEDNFSNIERLVSCVYPTGTEDVITCPYNMALATEYLTHHATCIFPVENRALLDIVTRQYNTKFGTEKMRQIIEFKPFFDINNIIVNMLLHLTSGSRFGGDSNVDINEINTNMVPFEKLHFLSSSVNPILTSNSKLIRKATSQSIKDEIFRNACSKNCHLLKIDAISSKSILVGATLIGRGDFMISDMRKYVETLQNKGRFMSWSRKAIKTGLCDIPPVSHTASMLCLFNTSSMSTLFSHILMLYKKLFKKKAHVHHYTEISGFDQEFFESCKNSLLSNIESYKKLEHSNIQ